MSGGSVPSAAELPPTRMNDLDPQRLVGRAQAEDGSPDDPWEKYGWIMGAIWLVFLTFPIMASAHADTSVPWRVASIASIALFAVAYVVGFLRLDGFGSWEEVHSFGVRVLGSLAVLCIVPAIVIGADALGMLPFTVSFAMFGLRLRPAILVGVTAIAAAIVVPIVLGQLAERWFFVVIIGLVFVTTGLVRVLDDRGAEHRELSRQMSLVSERERVARDVHDVLGHSLTVVTVKSELARRLVDADPERAKAELDDINALTRTALAEIRATVAGLRVARIDDELAAASVALCGAGIEARLPDDVSPADPRHRILLAWVLREAVTNVVRHSRAATCTVRLHAAGIDVEDDGVGTTGTVEGNGLRGLRERVVGAGGRIDVGPGTAGRGTLLEVRL